MSSLSNWEQGHRKGCTGRKAKALFVSYVLYYFYPHAASILVLDWELTGLGENHRNPLAQVLWLRSLVAVSKGFQARVRIGEAGRVLPGSTLTMISVVQD